MEELITWTATSHKGTSRCFVMSAIFISSQHTVIEMLLFCSVGHGSGPVHSGKRRSLEVVRNYEKVPRKMARMEEKEVIHLLPIKDKTGVIPQSVERGMIST